MALRQPESMNELVYFTNRDVGSGSARVWIFRKECPSCKSGIMNKPKMRAKEYLCSECGHSIPKTEYEDTLTANVEYVCPECGEKGELSAPYKRKTIKGVKTFRVLCLDCGGNIDITKKMKVPKVKKKKS